MDHGGADSSPPSGGGITWLEEMRTYIRDKHAGMNPVIPRHANVGMRPGKSQEGWWAGLEKQQQMELAADIFNVVFNTDLDLSHPVRVHDMDAALARTRAAHGGLPYKMAIQLDRSQNHLARFPTALNAKTMKKGRGVTNDGKNPHIRPTLWPRRAVDIHQLNCMGEDQPMCELCQRDVERLGGEANLPPDYQSVGYKGVEWLLKERGIPTAGKNLDELVPILAEMEDFKAELSAVCHILQSAGHVGFFNAVCHPELAYIEMIWAELKRLIRPKVDDTDETLVREMKAALGQIGVDFMRRCARNSRAAMKALRALRDNNRLCCPSVVKSLMGVQKRHRMAYAALTATTALAAGQELAKEAQKEAAKLKVRREQAEQTVQLKKRGEVRAARKRRSSNNERHQSELKRAKEEEEVGAGGEVAPAEL